MKRNKLYTLLLVALSLFSFNITPDRISSSDEAVRSLENFKASKDDYSAIKSTWDEPEDCEGCKCYVSKRLDDPKSRFRVIAKDKKSTFYRDPDPKVAVWYVYKVEYRRGDKVIYRGQDKGIKPATAADEDFLHSKDWAVEQDSFFIFDYAVGISEILHKWFEIDNMSMKEINSTSYLTKLIAENYCCLDTTVNSIRINYVDAHKPLNAFPYDTVCAYDMPYLFDSTLYEPNDAVTWSGIGVVDTSTGLYDPSIIGNTIPVGGVGIVDTIIMSFGSGTCQTFDTTYIYIAPLPMVDAESDLCYCMNYDTLTLIGYSHIRGGVWSGLGIIDVFNTFNTEIKLQSTDGFLPDRFNNLDRYFNEIIHWDLQSNLKINQIEIERSYDTIHWESIGLVLKDSLEVFTGKRYYYIDHNVPPYPISYYRLKQKNIYGKVSYSSIFKKEYNHRLDFTLFNPCKDSTILIHFQDTIRGMHICNELGEELGLNKEVNNNKEIIKIENINSGIYYLVYITYEGPVIKKFQVKSKSNLQIIIDERHQPVKERIEGLRESIKIRDIDNY